MENSESSTEQETLGTLFRRLRLERSLDIDDISKETKIPKKTIRAIEADDYAELPAYAFARGFYSLYAKMFELDPEEILQRYAKERNTSSPTKQSENIQSLSWKHENVGTMAERPAITPGSVIGFGLLIILLTSAGISWYAGYNPATSISQWLRSLQEDKQTITLPQTDTEISTGEEEENSAGLNTEQPPAAEETSTEPEIIQYRLTAEFIEATNISIAIDGNDPITLELLQGSVKTWHAQKTIVLEMDPGTETKLLLNDINIPIPEPKNDKVTIMIPEYLLDPNVHYSN